MDCTVPGCKTDLRSESVVSIRVLVCEKHRKAAAIEGGLAADDGSEALYRYCQQCGKVQELRAFDGRRRSCRESLERHRLRRRESEKRKLTGNSYDNDRPSTPSGGKKTKVEAAPAAVLVAQSPAATSSYGDASRVTPRSPGSGESDSVGQEASGQESLNYKETSSVQTSQGEFQRRPSVTGAQGNDLPWKIENELRMLDEMIKSNTHHSSLAPEDPPSYSLAGIQNDIKTADQAEYGDYCARPCSNGDSIHHYQEYGYQDSYYGDHGPCRNNGGYDYEYEYYQQHNRRMGYGSMYAMPRGEIYPPCPRAPERAASYLPADHYTYSTHMKIRNATPAHLPADLHGMMSSFHGGHPQLQGSIRPGCVHLAMDAWINAKEWQGKRKISSNIAAEIAKDVAARAPGRPWSNHDTDIFLHDKVLKIRNRGASISTTDRDTTFSVKLEHPLATADGDVSLTVSGLVDNIPFQACARVNGHYHDLEVIKRVPGPQPGSLNCVAFLPSGYVYGLAWIELFQNLPDGSVRISTASPVFITPQGEVAEELSTLALKSPGLPCPENVASWFKDFGEVLYCEDEPSSAEAYARCLLRAASRGWHHTIAEILDIYETDGVTLCSVLQAANPVGLLQLAVLSRSAETVKQVLELLTAENMLFAVAASGAAEDTSALHLAAEMACKEIADLLVDSCGDAHAHWMGHVGGSCHKTPVEIFTLVSEGRALAPLDEAEAAADAWGLGLLRQLQSFTGQALVLSPAAGVVVLSWAGMIDAMYMLPAFVLSFLILVVFPWVHKHYYVSVLRNVRQTASPLGLCVTRGLRLEDPLEEARYEKFANAEMVRPIPTRAVDVARVVIHTVPPVLSLFDYFKHYRTIHGVHFLLLLITIGTSLHSTWKAFGIRRVNSWPGIALHFPLLVTPAIKPWLLGKPFHGFPSAVQFSNSRLSLVLLSIYAVLQMTINYVPVDILLWAQICFLFQQEFAFYLLMDSLELLGFHSPPWLKPVSWCFTVTAMTIFAAVKVSAEGKRLVTFLKRTAKTD